MKVIVSPGYGAGWSTWGDRQSCLDQELATAIENQMPLNVIEEIAERNWPGQYQGGLEKAIVVNLPTGTRFEIQEYDGYESLRKIDDITDFLVA